ncbi:hypothetical protein SARC_00120 [Sphaeroforma arctica JP610]|uniref:C2H2-type domain-containing protein n=1 Tax=Sphaeroforma arctica JP610 TaxID=667725 RepID=A0A0L0GHN9_9EUKA|nr:hypothetical protein SARC_00120 [Sphaeroforma arctica JP610]KNC87863.1 hypothetical protein SARC_00120 [Sphaeroforma arctica JP610]|eukprot:XP_014161765.1 hypothetical protein SARC_00120 [Sphaeroforma arctica JP610]
MQHSVYPDGTSPVVAVQLKRARSSEESSSATASDSQTSEASSSSDSQGRAHKRVKAPHACDVCGMLCATPSKLKVHIRVHTGEQPYACKFTGCSKKFSRSDQLKRHMRTHTGEQPFACDFASCDKKFSTSCSLKTHMRTHTGDQPFACDFASCDKKFTQSQQLKSHMRTHTGEQPYACKFTGCSKRFSLSQHLKNHMRTHTGEQPYVCKFTGCSKKFSRSDQLKRHMRTHTGEQPYACKFTGCGKRFSLSHNLKSHMHTHTGDKPYVCDYTGCNRAFAQSSALNTHKQIHSPCVHCDSPGSLAGIDACADCAGTRLDLYGCTVANCRGLGTRGPDGARICRAHYNNGVCACTSPCYSRAAGACFDCIPDDSPQLKGLGLACSVDNAKVCTPNATVCSACITEYGLGNASLESLVINTVALILGMDTRSIFMTREVIIKACDPSKNACGKVNGGARGDWGLRGLNCINFIEIDDAKGHSNYDIVKEISRLNLLDGMMDGEYNGTGRHLTVGCTRFSGESGWELEQLRGFAQVVRDTNRVLEENPSDRLRLTLCNFSKNNKFRGALASTGEDYDPKNEKTEKIVLDDDIAQWTWASGEHKTAVEREARHTEILHTMKISKHCICASQLGTVREHMCTAKVAKEGEIFCNRCLKKPKAKRVIFDRK